MDIEGLPKMLILGPSSKGAKSKEPGKARSKSGKFKSSSNGAGSVEEQNEIQKVNYENNP